MRHAYLTKYVPDNTPIDRKFPWKREDVKEVWFHGFFQVNDGSEVGPYAVIEDKKTGCVEAVPANEIRFKVEQQ